MSFRIQPVRLRFKINHDWQRPGYSGSMFRGLFGHSLKALCCMTDSSSCTGCPLKNSCIYAQTFEPTAQVFNRKSGEIPTPFIINPPRLSTRIAIKAGATITLDMHLFGIAINWLPVLLTAWQNICHYNVGGQHKNFRFQLQQAELLNLQGETVYKNVPSLIHGPFEGYLPSLIETDGDPTKQQHYNLQLLTPLRLRQQKRNISVGQLNAEIFIKSLQRRYSLLVKHYSPQQKLPSLPDAEYPQLHVENLCWKDLQRWSNRQQRYVKLGGLTGILSLQGDLRPYSHALAYLPWINLGKNCNMGLGHILMNLG